ncbi:FCD domain-containing protein [Frigidibacter sp. MR17.14]|uniref:FadR/GntR family transcriptional regulator n=1 Tax=Frigidibacter sp. MR17.14 TaxID=3126509 RepID=UPI003012A708
MTAGRQGVAAGGGAAGDAADEIDRVARAVLRIREREGALPAERQLAERLEIKRHLLRRALLDLRARGALPTPSPRLRRVQLGAERAQDLARDTNPIEVMEMRLMIEPTLARLAAVRATPNQIAGMQAAIADRAPEDLHRLIAAAAGNGLARVLHDMVRVIEQDVRVDRHVEHMHPPDDAEQHRRIVAAIARRDAEAAEAEMRTHLQAIHRILSSALG